MAAVVANINQPDFSDSFIGWLQTVNKYPRAFDFKYESIVSILDINVATLFSYSASKERKICNDFTKKNCKFGFTLEEFEASWRKKLDALKFAITAYLKEPNGLTQTKFFIEKGNSDCRFNILNYLSPYWREITESGQEFHITFNLNSDEDERKTNVTDKKASWGEHYFRKNDEIFFMKRDEFWLAKRKGDIYTYRSAKLLKEPFKSASTGNLVNIFGLILDYNEKDSTVTVVDMSRVLSKYAEITGCKFESSDLHGIVARKPIEPSNTLKVASFKNSEFAEFPDWIAFSNSSLPKNASSMFVSDLKFAAKKLNKRANAEEKCAKLLKSLRTSCKNLKNIEPYWTKLWQKVVGIVDYVDPIQAVLRTWDLKFAVLPCQLKWSNNLMMVLPEKQEDGKCLKFTAATEGELFVVIATTPSDQNTWYIFQITTKGVIFYKEGKALLLNEDSAAGSTGNKNIYQNFFVCLNFERRKEQGKHVTGLYIQYGIQISSDETSHLYLSYFDVAPLNPSYYSFGSRNADVEIFNAHLESFDVDEQISLRCKNASNRNKAAASTLCDYKCNKACDGCTAPYSAYACKKCAYAALYYNNTLPGRNATSVNLVCADKCPPGYAPDPKQNNLCIGKHCFFLYTVICRIFGVCQSICGINFCSHFDKHFLNMRKTI